MTVAEGAGGIVCPMCGGKTLVLDSRRAPISVRRRRKCLKCGYRITTHELVVDRYPRGVSGEIDKLIAGLVAVAKTVRSAEEA